MMNFECCLYHGSIAVMWTKMTMMKILLPSSKNVSRPDIENVEQDAELLPEKQVKVSLKSKDAVNFGK